MQVNASISTALALHTASTDAKINALDVKLDKLLATRAPVSASQVVPTPPPPSKSQDSQISVSSGYVRNIFTIHMVRNWRLRFLVLRAESSEEEFSRFYPNARFESKVRFSDVYSDPESQDVGGSQFDASADSNPDDAEIEAVYGLYNKHVACRGRLRCFVTTCVFAELQSS